MGEAQVFTMTAYLRGTVVAVKKVDVQRVDSDTGTATGLGHLGKVTQLEAPHTSENYLLKEMGYQVARKHAGKLRRMALVYGLVLPALIILASGMLGGVPQLLLLGVAVVLGMGGVVVERWLFFAEARHLVTLYYGRSV